MIRLAPLLAAILIAGCAGDANETGDPEVLIRISNARAEPLHCRLIYGHWVERDLGLATIGGGSDNGIDVRLQQQPEDGALYVLRDDGRRRMMVENIWCAAVNDWQATVGQVDLAVVRAARPREVWVSCALPEAGGRVVCTPPKLWYQQP